MKNQNLMLKMISDEYDSIEDLLGSRKDPGAPDEGPTVINLMAEYFRNLYQRAEEGGHIAWVNFGMPPEIFWAFDIIPLVIDSVGGTLAANQDNIVKYVDSAHEHIPDYICANNKVILGVAFAGEIPPPSIMVHPSAPCDSNLSTYPVISEYMNFPYFCVDMPYRVTEDMSEEGLEYMNGEMWKLVHMLEEITQTKLDVDKLKYVMECSNKSHELLLKIAKLREAVPCPYGSMDTLTEVGLAMCLFGTPQVVEYLEQQYEKTKEKVEKNEGYMTKEQEKFRLAWVYGAPVFDYSLYRYLEKKYGAVSVANMNYNLLMEPVDLSSPDQMLKGIARKITKLPMIRECGGTFERYLDPAVDMITRFKADAAIFGGHVACKANWAIAKMAKDKIYEKTGVHTLNLELDLFDQRITSSDDVKLMFDNFFEMYLLK